MQAVRTGTGRTRKPLNRESKRNLPKIRKLCYELFSRIVRARPGGCRMHGQYISCSDVFQAAHGFSKRAYPAVRFDTRNGFKICSGHHRWSHEHTIEWQDFMVNELGPEGYEELREAAMSMAHRHPADWLGQLEEEALAAGLKA